MTARPSVLLTLALLILATPLVAQDKVTKEQAEAAIKTFKFSITYLMLLFVVLLVDHYSFYLWV